MTPAEPRAALVEALKVWTDSWWPYPEDGQPFFEEGALRALSAKLAELGLKIVPAEATEEMWNAGHDEASNPEGTGIGRIWSAMVGICEDVLE